MYVTVVPNRKSPPATLLRESYREEGKVKNRTLANISDWPPEQVEALRAVLKGDLIGVGPMPEVEASLPHGHVTAVLGTARRLGMEKLLSGKRGRERDLVMALVCGRVLAPSSKLALSQALQPGSAHHTLGQELGVEGATEDELYGAMDWLLERQEKIEAALAKKHLSNGCTVLYDLSSSYFEGTTCPLAKFGYSRDHRADRMQVNYGLLCNSEGIPVAIEVVEGNTGDPETIPAQVAKLKERFGLSHVVVVGDRGMVTTTQIEGAIEPGGFGWISALKHGAVEKLALEKVIQPSLFDQTGIAEISHASFPGERLVACMNPFMKTKREKVRENLLSLTEKELAKVAAACVRERRPLDGRDQVGLAAGRVVKRFGMAKYFRLHVGDHSLRFARRDEVIAREAATDGIYVIRTSEPKEAFTAEKAVETYKSLAKVERVFRCLKGVDLQVRPIHHRLEDRVKAHLLLCMLAYYVEWHLRRAWAGLLFHDEEGGTRTTPVAPVEPSEAAKAKKRSPRMNPDLPLQTYRGLIQSLAALSRSTIRLGSSTYTRCAKPTPLQAEAFKRLGLALP
jgi:transposase